MTQFRFAGRRGSRLDLLIETPHTAHVIRGRPLARLILSTVRGGAARVAGSLPILRMKRGGWLFACLAVGALVRIASRSLASIATSSAALRSAPENPSSFLPR